MMAVRFKPALALLGAAMILQAATAAEVYRWRDADGNLIFSDTPAPGAEKIVIEEPTVVPALTTPKREQASAQTADDAAAEYQAVSILMPTDRETIRNEHDVAVAVAVQPGLKVDAGHRLQLYLDGSAYGSPATEGSFLIEGIARGEHNIGVAVVDAKGRELKRAESIVVYVHLASTQHPAPRT